ncbi:hypothetical protein [Sporosarcina sp.]|uniref:hypothetical protein n=1 Tax=Sporosarcina sp. TaxID=49982 RepID=UPI002606B903|nr:hypothetical protein [Sporosarcina sp.]
MTNSKLLSSLCYFSIFFAPLLLPAIIFFATDEFDVKRHAKKSIISHIIPMVLLIAGFVVMSFSIFSFDPQVVAPSDNNFIFWSLTPLVFIILYSLLFLVVLIWNVYQGIKVLR